MRCNLAGWDRILRLIFGVILTTYMIIGGPFWSYAGIYLIITGAWGFCPAYVIFNIKTFRFPQRPTSKLNPKNE